MEDGESMRHEDQTPILGEIKKVDNGYLLTVTYVSARLGEFLLEPVVTLVFSSIEEACDKFKEVFGEKEVDAPRYTEKEIQELRSKHGDSFGIPTQN